MAKNSTNEIKKAGRMSFKRRTTKVKVISILFESKQNKYGNLWWTYFGETRERRKGEKTGKNRREEKIRKKWKTRKAGARNVN